MQIGSESEQYLEGQWGMKPLPTKEGIVALETLLQQTQTQGVVLYGKPSKMKASLVKEFTKNVAKKEIKVSFEKNGNPDYFQKEVEKTLLQLSSEILKLDTSRIATNKEFADYGFDSTMMVQFSNTLNEYYGIEMPLTALFSNPTIGELATFLVTDHRESLLKRHELNAVPSLSMKSQDSLPVYKNQSVSKRRKHFVKQVFPLANTTDQMAIIAMNGQFSSAASQDTLWNNIVEGKRLDLSNNDKGSSIPYGHVSLGDDSEGLPVLNLDATILSKMSKQENMVFSALSEALSQYDVNLEEISSKSTGVFIAAQQVLHIDDHDGTNQTLAYLIPNKVSYHLNLKGPSEVVNTYCTSIYVAIHRALQSISAGECEQAIVGGVNVISPKEMDYSMKTAFGELLSKDGHTRSFCDDGQGFVRSEGVGMMIIKPLKSAQKDNNRILGVIRGSAVYHGGRGFSLEAPSAKALKRAIETSIEKSGIPADTIDYIEAHGIANPMADAIELGAINKAYTSLSKDPAKKWHIGSVKSVVGHSELASGMASLIKVLKAFEHKTIPGIAGLEQVTTELSSGHSLLLSKEPTYWKNGTHPRRAALNSYAVGGVNAHIILEEYPSGSKSKEYSTKKNQTESPITPDIENHSSTSKASSKPVLSTMNAGEKKDFLLLIEKLLSVSASEIKEDTLLVALDLGSMQIVQFIQSVNLKFKTRITLGDVFQIETFGELLNFIAKKIASKEALPSDLDKHIIPFKEGAGEHIGIILPGMPGMVDGYFELAENLKEETVYGIQMVGFDGDKPLETIEAIAQHYYDAIQKIASGKKITLYAHSYGGIILYELLQLLEAKSIQIEQVILIDSYANVLKTKLNERIAFFMYLLQEQLKLPTDKKEIMTFSQKVIKRPKKIRADLIYKYLTKKGAKIDKEFFSRMYLLYDTSMNIKYQLKEKLQTDIIFVKAKEGLFEEKDSSLDWSPYYKSVKIIESDGDHFSIVKAPFVSKWLF
jgi:3-oxoacyl-(acyl-carrier-protein) synthase/thioesterase domain-containing protein/acyl carrier protein